MPTTDEIRAAITATDRPVEPRVTNEAPEMWAELTEWEAERADTLAACVRELYEAHVRNLRDIGLIDELCDMAGVHRFTVLRAETEDIYDRYRAALEGGDDE